MFTCLFCISVVLDLGYSEYVPSQLRGEAQLGGDLAGTRSLREIPGVTWTVWDGGSLFVTHATTENTKKKSTPHQSVWVSAEGVWWTLAAISSLWRVLAVLLTAAADDTSKSPVRPGQCYRRKHLLKDHKSSNSTKASRCLVRVMKERNVQHTIFCPLSVQNVVPFSRSVN